MLLSRRQDDCAKPSVCLERESAMVWSQGTGLCGSMVVHGCYTRGDPRPHSREMVVVSGREGMLLKWLHAACPKVLANLFNMCLEQGIHLWWSLVVAVTNKSNKPDYSAPKAYCPISLLKCMGKLLEKVIAKQVNANINVFHLLPPSQFGLQPHHCAINAVSTLVHRIQSYLCHQQHWSPAAIQHLGLLQQHQPKMGSLHHRKPWFPRVYVSLDSILSIGTISLPPLQHTCLWCFHDH